MAASEDVLAIPVAEPAPTVRRAGPWLPRFAVLGAVVAVLEAVFIAYASSRGDSEVTSPFALDTFGLFAAAVTFPLVGALILTRRPRTRIAWVMVAIGLSIGTGNALAAWGATGVSGPTLPLAVLALVIAPVFVGSPLILGFAMLLLLYPTDQLPGRRWTSVAILAAVGSVLFEAATLFRSDDLFPGLPNPLAAPIRFAVIDPVRAAENLAREAVADLDATAVGVLDGSGSLVASAGSWPPADPADVTEIRLSGEGPFAAIVLGPRRGARAYPNQDLADLAEAGRLTAAAVRPA